MDSCPEGIISDADDVGTDQNNLIQNKHCSTISQIQSTSTHIGFIGINCHSCSAL